jgi:hypothetical protein
MVPLAALGTKSAHLSMLLDAFLRDLETLLRMSIAGPIASPAKAATAEVQA